MIGIINKKKLPHALQKKKCLYNKVFIYFDKKHI
jgi:hypothetical protein